MRMILTLLIAIAVVEVWCNDCVPIKHGGSMEVFLVFYPHFSWTVSWNRLAYLLEINVKSGTFSASMQMYWYNSSFLASVTSLSSSLSPSLVSAFESCKNHNPLQPFSLDKATQPIAEEDSQFPTMKHIFIRSLSRDATGLPPSCPLNISTPPPNDDDDETSIGLSYPESIHCSTAGLLEVPLRLSPNPSSILFL